MPPNGTRILYSSKREAAGIHLLAAARAGRCLVTRNRDDFVALSVRFLQDDSPHAGVLIVPYTMPTDRFNLVAAAIAQYDRDHPDGISPYGFDYVSRSHAGAITNSI